MGMGNKAGRKSNSVGMIYVGEDLAEELEKLSDERGLTMEQIINTAMKNLRPRITKLELDTLLPFGKYHGAKTDTIIRADPDYMRWVHKSVDKVCFSEAAIKLLDEIEAAIYDR